MKLFTLVLLLATVLFAVPQTTLARGQQIYHFHMGQGTAVTYATGPANLVSSENETHRLQRTGTPVFFASAPEARPGGSILFTHDNGHYHTPESWVQADERFVLEVWVKSLESANENTSTPNSRGVAGIGTGARGYYIMQRGSAWQVLTGGVGWVSIGEVTPGEWVHLALVADGNERTVWKNGRNVGEFYQASAIDSGFNVGTIGADSNEAFHGEVYEVRLKRLGQAEFDPQSGFLLDYEQLSRLRQADLERTMERIKHIVRPGEGIRISDSYVPEPDGRDFLIHPVDRASVLHMVPGSDGSAADLILENGLISRNFYVSENLGSISYRNLSNGAEFLRAVKPEARLNIDGRWIVIGGLSEQPEHSYLLREWLPDMTAPSGSWVLSDIITGPIEERYPWQQKFNARPAQWPPAGLRVTMTYEPPDQEQDLAGLIVQVHYEIYDGIPVLSKWVTVENGTGRSIVVEETETEILAVNQDQLSRLHVESDYSFALVNASPRGSALMHYAGEPEPFHAGESTTRWLIDSEYDTWATHNQAEDQFLGFQHHNMMVSRLPMGPSATVSPGDDFSSFRTFELLFDSDDRVRNTLAHRRLYRVLAPQVTESLLTAAITSSDTEVLKNMIDQMAELGFERLDIHPWPGVSHNNLDKDYIAHWQEIAEYAALHDIIMGGYELVIASRGRGARYNTVDPLTGEPGSLFGQSVCIATDWGDQYVRDTFEFFDQTGFRSWNADGPYHGDPCASESHAGHRWLHDSQWEQWKRQVAVLHEMQRRNFYLPIPDWYFLNGQSATGMGYREASANLTPQQQLLLGRQYIYDGTWHKIPTMGWMTLQLVGFYTRDSRVGLEPLHENLDRYETGLFQYLASGAQFTVRGDRLYDTAQTRDMVAAWVNWFKEYREVLTGDIIHMGRPNGRSLDYMLHVNPQGRDRALLAVFNPTDSVIQTQVQVPLYYAGLDEQAHISHEGGAFATYPVSRTWETTLTVEVPAGGFTWYVIR